MGRLSEICEQENLQIKQAAIEDLRELCGNSEIIDGSAVRRNGQNFILLDKNLKGYKKILVLAHETAHHIFGHLDTLENGGIPKDFEDEARLFSVVYAALYMFAESEVNA